MGATATAINLTPGSWSELKPKDYKGSDLDKALSTLQSSRGKDPGLDKDSISSLEKRAAYLKDLQAALKSVTTAAGKASADLKKQAKDKDDRGKQEYTSAAGNADVIGQQASSESAKYK